MVTGHHQHGPRPKPPSRSLARGTPVVPPPRQATIRQSMLASAGCERGRIVISTRYGWAPNVTLGWIEPRQWVRQPRAGDAAATGALLPSGLASRTARWWRCGNTPLAMRCVGCRLRRAGRASTQPAQRSAAHWPLVPAALDHQSPTPARTVAKPARDREPQRVLALPGLLVQEVCARQAHRNVGMAAQVHQSLVRIPLRATPALRRTAAAASSRVLAAAAPSSPRFGLSPVRGLPPAGPYRPTQLSV
jgi:hypothetical protein